MGVLRNIRHFREGGETDPLPTLTQEQYDRYLSYLRRQESQGRNVPNARGSSAHGPYQYMPDTWANDSAGLTWNGRTLTPEDRLNADAQDYVMRQRTLPAYIRDFRRTLNRDPEPWEVLAQHRLGSRGGLSLLQANPGDSVDTVIRPNFPNRNVVYDQNPYLGTRDRPRTVGGVLASLRGDPEVEPFVGGGGGPSSGGPGSRNENAMPANPNNPTRTATTSPEMDDIRMMRRAIMQNLPTPEARAEAIDRLRSATQRLSDYAMTSRRDTGDINLPLLAAGAAMMTSNQRGLIPTLGEGAQAAGRTIAGERELDRRDRLMGLEALRGLSQFEIQELDRMYTSGMGNLHNAIQLSRTQFLPDRFGGITAVNPITGEVSAVQSRVADPGPDAYARAMAQANAEIAGLPAGYWDSRGGVEARNAWLQNQANAILRAQVEGRAAILGTQAGVGQGQVATPNARPESMTPIIPSAPGSISTGPQPPSAALPAPGTSSPGGAASPPGAGAALPAAPGWGVPGIPTSMPPASAPPPTPVARGEGVAAPAATIPALEASTPPSAPPSAPPLAATTPASAPVAPPAARSDLGTPGTAPAPLQAPRIETPQDTAARGHLQQELQAGYVAAQTRARAAAQLETTLGAFENAMNQFRTGYGAEARRRVQETASSIASLVTGRNVTIDLTGSTDMATLLNNLQRQFLPAMREGTGFSRVTNYDAYILQQMSPNMSNPSTGNREIIRFLRWRAESDRATAQAYQENLRRHNGLVQPDVEEDIMRAIYPIGQRFLSTMGGGTRADEGNRFRQQLQQRQQGHRKGGRIRG